MFSDYDVSNLMEENDENEDMMNSFLSRFKIDSLPGSSSPQVTPSSATAPKSPVDDAATAEQLEAKAALRKQAAESQWHQFVDNHLILKQGFVHKRKGLFSKHRMLLLTEGPRLFYVDANAMVLKGEIPWTRDLRPEAKNFRIFFIHTPSRIYYLEDPESTAVDWCKFIEQVHARYFEGIKPSIEV